MSCWMMISPSTGALGEETWNFHHLADVLVFDFLFLFYFHRWYSAVYNNINKMPILFLARKKDINFNKSLNPS